MNHTIREERCWDCDDPTGRAGRCDDSIYCDCGLGPFCEECWGIHIAIGKCPKAIDT